MLPSKTIRLVEDLYSDYSCKIQKVTDRNTSPRCKLSQIPHPRDPRRQNLLKELQQQQEYRQDVPIDNSLEDLPYEIRLTPITLSDRQSKIEPATIPATTDPRRTLFTQKKSPEMSKNLRSTLVDKVDDKNGQFWPVLEIDLTLWPESRMSRIALNKPEGNLARANSLHVEVINLDEDNNNVIDLVKEDEDCLIVENFVNKPPAVQVDEIIEIDDEEKPIKTNARLHDTCNSVEEILCISDSDDEKKLPPKNCQLENSEASKLMDVEPQNIRSELPENCQLESEVPAVNESLESMDEEPQNIRSELPENCQLESEVGNRGEASKLMDVEPQNIQSELPENCQPESEVPAVNESLESMDEEPQNIRTELPENCQLEPEDSADSESVGGSEASESADEDHQDVQSDLEFSPASDDMNFPKSSDDLDDIVNKIDSFLNSESSVASGSREAGVCSDLVPLDSDNSILDNIDSFNLENREIVESLKISETGSWGRCVFKNQLLEKKLMPRRLGHSSFNCSFNFEDAKNILNSILKNARNLAFYFEPSRVLHFIFKNYNKNSTQLSVASSSCIRLRSENPSTVQIEEIPNEAVVLLSTSTGEKRIVRKSSDSCQSTLSPSNSHILPCLQPLISRFRKPSSTPLEPPNFSNLRKSKHTAVSDFDSITNTSSSTTNEYVDQTKNDNSSEIVPELDRVDNVTKPTGGILSIKKVNIKMNIIKRPAIKSNEKLSPTKRPRLSNEQKIDLPVVQPIIPGTPKFEELFTIEDLPQSIVLDESKCNVEEDDVTMSLIENSNSKHDISENDESSKSPKKDLLSVADDSKSTNKSPSSGYSSTEDKIPFLSFSDQPVRSLFSCSQNSRYSDDEDLPSEDRSLNETPLLSARKVDTLKRSLSEDNEEVVSPKRVKAKSDHELSPSLGKPTTPDFPKSDVQEKATNGLENDSSNSENQYLPGRFLDIAESQKIPFILDPEPTHEDNVFSCSQNSKDTDCEDGELVIDLPVEEPPAESETPEDQNLDKTDCEDLQSENLSLVIKSEEEEINESSGIMGGGITEEANSSEENVENICPEDSIADNQLELGCIEKDDSKLDKNKSPQKLTSTNDGSELSKNISSPQISPVEAEIPKVKKILKECHNNAVSKVTHETNLFQWGDNNFLVSPPPVKPKESAIEKNSLRDGVRKTNFSLLDEEQQKSLQHQLAQKLKKVKEKVSCGFVKSGPKSKNKIFWRQNPKPRCFPAGYLASETNRVSVEKQTSNVAQKVDDNVVRKKPEKEGFVKNIPLEKILEESPKKVVIKDSKKPEQNQDAHNSAKKKDECHRIREQDTAHDKHRKMRKLCKKFRIKKVVKIILVDIMKDPRYKKYRRVKKRKGSSSSREYAPVSSDDAEVDSLELKIRKIGAEIETLAKQIKPPSVEAVSKPGEKILSGSDSEDEVVVRKNNKKNKSRRISSSSESDGEGPPQNEIPSSSIEACNVEKSISGVGNETLSIPENELEAESTCATNSQNLVEGDIDYFEILTLVKENAVQTLKSDTADQFFNSTSDREPSPKNKECSEAETVTNNAVQTLKSDTADQFFNPTSDREPSPTNKECSEAETVTNNAVQTLKSDTADQLFNPTSDREPSPKNKECSEAETVKENAVQTLKSDTADQFFNSTSDREPAPKNKECLEAENEEEPRVLQPEIVQNNVEEGASINFDDLLLNCIVNSIDSNTSIIESGRPNIPSKTVPPLSKTAERRESSAKNIENCLPDVGEPFNPVKTVLAPEALEAVCENNESNVPVAAQISHPVSTRETDEKPKFLLVLLSVPIEEVQTTPNSEVGAISLPHPSESNQLPVGENLPTPVLQSTHTPTEDLGNLNELQRLLNEPTIASNQPEIDFGALQPMEQSQNVDTAHQILPVSDSIPPATQRTENSENRYGCLRVRRDLSISKDHDCTVDRSPVLQSNPEVYRDFQVPIQNPHMKQAQDFTGEYSRAREGIASSSNQIPEQRYLNVVNPTREYLRGGEAVAPTPKYQFYERNLPYLPKFLASEISQDEQEKRKESVSKRNKRHNKMILEMYKIMERLVTTYSSCDFSPLLIEPGNAINSSVLVHQLLLVEFGLRFESFVKEKNKRCKNKTNSNTVQYLMIEKKSPLDTYNPSLDEIVEIQARYGTLFIWIYQRFGSIKSYLIFLNQMYILQDLIARSAQPDVIELE